MNMIIFFGTLQESSRRRMNSDGFDVLQIASSDMYSKSSILSSIYGNGKISMASEDPGWTSIR